MESSTHPRLRVAVSAAPPLLADSLRTLLDDERTDVTVILGPAERRFDVALVTPGAADVVADLVIELDDPLGEGGTARGEGGEAWRLGSLAAILRTVHDRRPEAFG